MKNLLPLYRKPYPDGSSRVHHGVVHATRTAFFSAVIAEMYIAQGASLSVKPQHLPLADFFMTPGARVILERTFGMHKVEKFVKKR